MGDLEIYCVEPFLIIKNISVPTPHHEKISWSRGLNIFFFKRILLPPPGENLVEIGNKLSKTLSHYHFFSYTPPRENLLVSWSKYFSSSKWMHLPPPQENLLVSWSKYFFLIMDAPTPTRRKSRGLVVELEINCLEPFHMIKIMSVPHPTTRKSLGLVVRRWKSACTSTTKSNCHVVKNYIGCPYPHQEKISWSHGGFKNISHYQNYFCPYTPPRENLLVSW